MDINELFQEYCSFERKHNDHICSRLKETFDETYQATISWVFKSCDFAALIGIPLFIVFLVWGGTLNLAHSTYLPLAVIVALGIVMRWFTKHVITITCRDIFRKREYIDVLTNYVDECWSQAIEAAASDEDIDQINELYRYFKREITSADFRCYR